MLARKDLRQVLAGLLAIAIAVVYVLVLVGCHSTSPGLPGLYFVRLSNSATGAEVRVGLFSLCAGLGSDAKNLTCGGTFGGIGSGEGNDTTAADNTTSTTTTAAAAAAAAASLTNTTRFLLPGSATAVAPAALQPLLALAAGIQNASTGPGGVLSAVYVPLLLSALCFVAGGGCLVAVRFFARRAAKHGDLGYDAAAPPAAVQHARRAWTGAVLLASTAVMAAVAAAIASTVAVRALLFAGTALPGTAATAAAAALAAATSTSAVDVAGGVSVQVLQWLVVVLTLLWNPLLDPLWQKLL